MSTSRQNLVPFCTTQWLRLGSGTGVGDGVVGSSVVVVVFSVVVVVFSVVVVGFSVVVDVEVVVDSVVFGVVLVVVGISVVVVSSSEAAMTDMGPVRDDKETQGYKNRS